MRLGLHLNFLLSKFFAILWTVAIGLTLIGESLGRHFWQRPLSASEMVVFALSIPGVWMIYVITGWWFAVLDDIRR